MQLQDFNTEGAAPLYGYERSPVNERSFLIMRKNEMAENGQPVGDYTVLDSDEDPGLSEKKVMNLISLLNGRDQLMQLGHETNSRVLYRIINDGEDGEEAKVIFYHLGQQGVSKENAMFRFKEEGVL